MGEAAGTRVALSFDVEEHDRIEAAAGLAVPAATRAEYAVRMDVTTRRLLDLLAAHDAVATFYVVGQIAETHPQLVRAIVAGGHELGAHGWDHRRLHRLTPEGFRDDARRCKDVLERVSGEEVAGYRAPTFSVARETAWGIDVLAEAGYRYDSSVFPVRHDRYGVPHAPRVPFVAVGPRRELLELPPATWRVGGQNLPIAGGGYFRLFPLRFVHAGIRQLTRQGSPLAMLYFHPWEFDPTQPRLPLKRLARFRTYVGIGRTTERLTRLLGRYRGRFARAIDVARDLEAGGSRLARYTL